MTNTASKRLRLLAAAAASLLLSACDGRVHYESDGPGRGELKTLARLECPEREDQLDRVSASPDGLACDYAGEGAQVKLQLVPLNGRTPEAVLAAYETEFRALMPTLTPAEEQAPMSALDIETDVTVGVESNEEKAHVRMPGMSIDADGDRAQIRIGNTITIDADDTDSVVKVRGDDGDVSVNADDNGAEIRTSDSGEGGMRSTFILASESASPNGLRLVGYEARGPVAGPLLVATIRSTTDDSDQVIDAMKDLVRKNIGADRRPFRAR
jgi:hypothetical protein